MKIAITTEGSELSSPVDARFGRARYFVVCDTDGGDIEVIDNEQNLNAAQGAGIQSAKHVVDAGVQAVITGNVGPKAFASLQAAGVAVHVGASGTAAEALEAFNRGELGQADSANVESRWM